MKKCTYCGTEYPDEALVCAIDGQPLREVIPAAPESLPPPVGERQTIIDGEHIKMLSIFHFVVAGLALLGVVFLFLHYFLMSSVFSNPEIWKSQKDAPPLPKDFLKNFVWFYIFMGAIFGTMCVLNLLSGLFLRQKRHRTFSLVVGGLNCLQIPFGTVLGIFTIIVLSRNSVRQKYVS
jgi:hypothetical protein